MYPALRILTASLLVVFSACDHRITGSKELVAYRVVSQRPHDPAAYTQGLQLHQGRLWESTGTYGRSSIREVDPATGKVTRKRLFEKKYFGEGMTWHDGRIWMLTWREKTAFLIDPSTLETLRTFSHDGEGWGLTSDGIHLIASDGTSTLRYIDASNFTEVGRIRVTAGGHPVNNLNELEYVNGDLYANVYMTDLIARIDPTSGQVTGWLDLSPLRDRLPRPHRAETLNGIAYDSESGNLLVTGKYWPSLFELRLD